MEAPGAEVADTPVDVGSPADVGGGADDSSLSQDAILEKYSEPSTTEEAPVEAEGKQAATPVDAKTKPGAEEKPAEQAKEEEEVVEPLLQEPETEDLKKAFKSMQKWHPDVAKQIRNSWFENKAYKELFTVPEAREMREVFQSVQEAKDAKGAMADVMAMDELLNTQPGTLLNHIQQRNPQAFVNMALQMPKFLYNMDPAIYRHNVSEPAVRNYHDFFANKARETGNQDVLTALEILQEFERQTIGGPQAGQQQPQYQADPRMLQRLQQLEGERAQAFNQSINTFRDTVDSDFDSAISGEVTKIIDRSGADLSDAAKQEIAERVLSDVKDKLLTDDVLQRRLAWELNRGSRDGRHRQALANFVVSNAKRFIPSSASQHLTWMTKEILRANATTLDKASKVSPTRNVRGGSPGSSPPGRLTQDQLSKMSENEILDAAAAGLLG